MEFTRFDIAVLFSMSLAIVFMAFAFPALGFAGEEQQEDDIPEFNVSDDRFDFAGDFPTNPNTPSQGTLIRERAYPETDHRNRMLQGRVGEEDAIRLVLFNSSTASDPEVEVELQTWDSSGNLETTSTTLTDVDDEGTLADFGWDVAVRWDELENFNESDTEFEVFYRVFDRPQDESFIGGIPVVGTIFSAGEALASIVGWIGSVLWWGITWLFEISANLLGMLFDVTFFVIILLHWMLSTYTDIIASASSWATVIVTLPAVLLMLVMGKLVMIGVSLLPTT